MESLHQEGKRRLRQGELLPARRAMARALEQGEESWELHSDYGEILTLCGDYEEALEQFQNALALAPGQDDVLYRLSMIHLVRGDFAQGWPLYRHRPNPWSAYPRPQWDGARLPTGTILLCDDLGLG